MSDIRISNEAAAATGPLVTGVYENQTCLSQQGGNWMTPLAVIETGAGGPAVLFWQISAWTQLAPDGFKAQPVIANASDQTTGAAFFFNNSAVHAALLRRRALLSPLSPGESFFQIVSADNLVTDQNDVATAILLNLGSLSTPPQVRLSAWSTAQGTNGEYTAQNFYTAGGPLLIAVHASGWSKYDNQLIGAVLYCDGEPIAYPQLYANQSGTHLALVGTDKVYTASPGEHQLALMADSQTVCDNNDVWSLTVIEMQGNSTVTQLFDAAPCPTQSGGSALAAAQYTSQGGVLMLLVQVSGFATAPSQTLQAQVLVDGDEVGSLQIFANQAEQHMMLCGGDIAPGAPPAGPHTVEVYAGAGMSTDGNDRISITVVEVLP